MKSIFTLIPDIYALLESKGGWFSDELRDEFSQEVGRRLQEKFSKRDRKPTLRLSKMGPVCPCALWHSIHKPELEEKLPGWTINKFAYGDILEAWVLVLAKAAGHDVCGEQDEVSVDGIIGHRDCVIDGAIVDVKSANSRSFAKFDDGSIGQDDKFGYLDQLDGYLVGSADDPLVLDKEHGYLLAVDKELGYLALYQHTKREDSIRQRIKWAKQVVALPEPPPCECGEEADGESGNMKLDVRASYNGFKFCCKPHIRVFKYSGAPRFLTKVVRRPKRKDGTLIPEVDRNGNPVFSP